MPARMNRTVHLLRIPDDGYTILGNSLTPSGYIVDHLVFLFLLFLYHRVLFDASLYGRCHCLHNLARRYTLYRLHLASLIFGRITRRVLDIAWLSRLDSMIVIAELPLVEHIL
jgi:hypothetical protein